MLRQPPPQQTCRGGLLPSQICMALALLVLLVETSAAFLLIPSAGLNTRLLPSPPALRVRLLAAAPLGAAAGGGGAVEGPSPPPPPPPRPTKVTLTVLGGKEGAVVVPDCKVGANLRKTLRQQKGVEVYDMIGKMTNCNGAGQCLTCVVKVEGKGPAVAAWGLRSEYEEAKLGAKGWKGDQYRLSCQTAIGPADATITVRPAKPK